MGLCRGLVGLKNNNNNNRFSHQFIEYHASGFFICKFKAVKETECDVGTTWCEIEFYKNRLVEENFQ